MTSYRTAVRTRPLLDLEQLLIATTVGIYFLVILGAGTAVLDGASACGTWPTCGGVAFETGLTPGLVAAWVHRFAAGIVGVLVIVTAVRTLREGLHPKVKMAIRLMGVLYPVQVVLGALVVLTGSPTILPLLHLTVGLLIFTCGIAAITWRLDRKQRAGVPGPLVPTGAATSDRSSGGGPHSTGSGTGDWRPDASVSTSQGPKETGPIGQVQAYIRLMKPKLMWLLCLVAFASMALAAGPTLRFTTVIPTLVGGVLAIGASGTFNNVLERDVDKHMDRTADRPVVQGQVPAPRAYLFGGALTLLSAGVFLVFVNLLAAVLGLLAILFYSVVYTLVLKPNTAQNTVIGGAVGAFPALIGWAAVTETVGVPALALGAVIFLWTPAHFYNLALIYRDQYEAAGVPMFPVVHGPGRTRVHVLVYFGGTMGAVVVLGSLTRLDLLFALAATVLGGVFLWSSIDLFESRTDQAAFRTFTASNVYLGLLLVAIVGDSLLV